MNILRKTPSVHLLTVTFTFVWLASVLASPTCHPRAHHVDVLIGTALITWILGPVVTYLLIKSISAAFHTPIVTTKHPAWAGAASAMLAIGTVGGLLSLGCGSLEATWPTLTGIWASFTGASHWKVAGQWLMFVGVLGLVVAQLSARTLEARRGRR